ncbi:MAG: ADP-ribose pyrophosphatase, partial [Hyphomicrobiales bacterium]
TEYIHLFVCTELTRDALTGDEDEDIVIHRRTLPEALAAIQSGEIADGKSVIGLLRYAQRTH